MVIRPLMVYMYELASAPNRTQVISC